MVIGINNSIFCFDFSAACCMDSKAIHSIEDFRLKKQFKVHKILNFVNDIM